jgi:hypothetical protein
MNEESVVVGYLKYADQTTVHPLGLLAVAVLGLCVLVLPRRWSVLPLLVMACFISSAQRIVVIGLDFNFLRIMVLFGVIRLVQRKEHLGFVWKPLDTVMVFWAIIKAVFFVIRVGTFSAVVNRLGFAFDAFGMYFLFRCLIRDWKDVNQVILGCIWISIPVAFFFLIELRTGRNLFAIFGGLHEITLIREGRLRCQGAFSHAILAGCFWASLMPLFATFWWKSTQDRIWAITGVVTSMIIVICCASSTPVMGVFAALIGGLFFFLRRQMRLVRWAILLTLTALHLVMQAPVWHLVSRASAVGGSTGWHRYNLINQTITHFDEWWLGGCSAYKVASWGITAGDVTNQYIAEGITSGLLTMCLFIAIIVIAFRKVGRLWRSRRRDPHQLALSWAFGTSLFVHCTVFVGVTYFGQIQIIWYLLLAIICSLPSLPVPNKFYVDRRIIKNFAIRSVN